MQAVRYALAEGWRGLDRSRRPALASIGTIAGAIVAVGAVLIVTSNLERLAAAWTAAAEMSIYLDDDATDADRRAIEGVLASSGVVASSEHVSKPEALARFTRDFEELAPVATSFQENPFPASIEVRLRPGSEPTADSLAARLVGTRGVSDVRYDRRWVDRLLGVVAAVRGIGLTIAAVLILGASLTVANVVRLTTYARRGELEIMELVGAPLRFVRGPFVVEGAIQGAVGAGLGLAILWAGFTILESRYGSTLLDATGVDAMRFVPLQMVVVTLVLGTVAGSLGGLIAALGASGSGSGRQARAGPRNPLSD